MQIDHKNILLLNNKKKIQAAAFNQGIEKANGEIIIRLDAHSKYDINYIYYCVLDILESDYGNVGGCCKAIPGSDTIIGKTIAIINNSPFGLGGATYRTGNSKKITKNVPFGAFPKKIIAKIGKMNENLPRGEDVEFNTRLRAAGYKVLFDPRIITYYYSRGTLKLLLKQQYDNGFSIGVLIRNFRETLSFHHIIPVLFVSFLIFGFFLSFHYSIIKMIYFSVVLLYFLLSLVNGIVYVKRSRLIIIPIMICLTFLVHLVYGIGTIEGSLKGRY
jgi:glycosyltransferase involved in cell wall biosynthesis